MTRLRNFLVAACTVMALAFVAGCGNSVPDSADGPVPRSTPSSEKRFPVTGVVRKVDIANGILTIRHDDIPDYMPAMTMPFDLADPASAQDVQPGDRVRGTLVVSGEQSSLHDVVVTEWADAAAAADANRAGAVLKPGDLVPDFTMTSQSGEPLLLSSLRGHVVVLTFIYTRCPLPDFCPAMDKRFAELSRRLQLLGTRGDNARLLSISFDPEHDTPETLRKHAKMLGAEPPRWTFSVATHPELQRVSGAFGLSYGPGDNEIIHTLSTAIIGPDGKLVALYQGKNWTSDEVFARIRPLLAPGGGP